MKRITFALTAGAVLTVAACGGEKGAEPVPVQQEEGVLTPAPGGRIINIEMITEGEGNFFRPAHIDARPGDVLRFTLVSGAHAASFLLDSNSGKKALPGKTRLLQLPGQTFDLAVPSEPGEYHFQCDEHALDGMVGHLEVAR